MCLYPKLIRNKKYLPNRKNNFNPPLLTDIRVGYVAVGCGNCIECRKQKARDWKIRLSEELKVNKYAYFITFTFSNEELKKLCKETNLSECNAVAGKAIRRYLERWRKKYKKSQRHWFITELGHVGTERIHIHGVIFNNFPITQELLEDFWKYGTIFIGEYCNEKTINYIIKYVTKIDKDHKGWKSEIFCSAGIGKNYTEKEFSIIQHKFDGKDTIEYYRTSSGFKMSLPIYYRNKFFTEEEREKLWVNRIEEGTRYVLGVEIKDIYTEHGEKAYQKVLQKARETNMEIGYGSDEGEWKEQEYNVTMRMLNRKSARANLKH